MIVKLYSIRDRLTGYNPPIAFKDERIAQRWFESFCKQKKDQEYIEPKYYELYEVGTFDTENGSGNIFEVGQSKLIKEGEQFE